MAILLTYFTPFSSVSIVNFVHVNTGWDSSGDKKQLDSNIQLSNGILKSPSI